MRISELFYSVQGEGKLTGVPSFFIRSSGCNLRCRWCDTPYASWKPEGEEMSNDQIIEEVKKTPTRHVVMTGGEPMLAKGVSDLLSKLRAEGMHITIETAGTLPPDGIACDLASISPKLKNSVPDAEMLGVGWLRRHEETRWQPDVIRQWMSQHEHQLKFVITQEKDLEEIDELLVDLNYPTAPENILLMPEGRTIDDLGRITPFLVEECKNRGWRYCARLHIDLFGNKRGV